jgi:general stress protein 26
VPDNHFRSEAIANFAEKIGGLRVAMLVTMTAAGRLRSRPMVAQQVEFDGDLWFLTRRTTAKASEIRDRQQVNVSYVSPDDNRYVSVSGTATIVEDREQASALWNPSYQAWIPLGSRDPELILIKVRVDEAEYWDESSNSMVRLAHFPVSRTGFREVEPGAGT